MADYPFKINIKTKNGTELSYATSSFATDADAQVSASVMVTKKINKLRRSINIVDDDSIDPNATGSTYVFRDVNGAQFLSASFTEPNTGSVVFTDTDTAISGGLDSYTFFGTKVCSVLGIPEGVPIFTENFRLSDDANNPSNYVSGDIIADGVNVKNSFSMSPIGRMRSNFLWDHVFGEGYLMWVSGSTTKLRMGYDNVNDRYEIVAGGTSGKRITGFNSVQATTMTASIYSALGQVTLQGGSLTFIKGGSVGVVIDASDSGNPITFSGAGIDITDTTDATDDSGDTGALRCEGGASIAKKLFVGTDLDVDGTANLDVVDIDGAVDMASNLDIAGNLDVDGTTDLDATNIVGAVSIKGDTTFVDANSSDTIVKIHDSNDDGLVDVYANNSVKIRLHGNGHSYFSNDVSIGGTEADGDAAPRLTVYQDDANFVASFVNSTNNTAADGIMVNYTANSALGSSAKFIQVRDSSDDVCYEVKGGGSGNSTVVTSFTAGHDTACLDEDELMPGLIIESTGEVWYKPSSSFDTALPYTRLSNTNGSKTVFGVVDGVLLKYDVSGSVINADKGEQYVKNGYYMPPAFTSFAKYAPTGSANRQLNTMSIGEGVVWVTNINGEIENGDYIESSVIKGYGRKQNDDILRSKTVAKCTETIDWTQISSSIEYSGSAYKKYKCSATFHCG